MLYLKRFAAAFVLTIAAVSSVFSLDVPVSDIPDDSELRASLSDSLFLAPAAEALRFRSRRSELPDGTPVEIRVERGNGEFIIVVARARDGAFPVAAQGGWALYRRNSDGAPTRIRIFLRSDPYCYLQIRPDQNGRAALDAVAYGGYFLRSAPIAIPFERVLSEPLSRIIALAGPLLPLRYFEPKPGDYADLRLLSASIRAGLKDLSYVDDGAFDEAGRSVLIASGEAQPIFGGVNCSGFAKWVADGMLRGAGMAPLAIGPLKIPPIPRGNPSSDPYEGILDPYFGLDWTRNLALALGKAFRGGRPETVVECEVRSIPLAALRISGGDGSQARSFPAYLGDAGFPMDGLKPALYALALDEPGHVYFGSISSDMVDRPYVRRHFHVAVFIPQFDEAGNFSIAVFESGIETGFDSFVARYPGHFVNLVRAPAEALFHP